MNISLEDGEDDRKHEEGDGNEENDNFERDV
jgi:hypothetical protein